MNRYREMLDFYSGNQWDRRRRAGRDASHGRTTPGRLVRKTVELRLQRAGSFSVAASKSSGVGEELAAAGRNAPERAVRRAGSPLARLQHDGRCGRASAMVRSRSPGMWTLALRSSRAWILRACGRGRGPDNVRKVTRVVQRYYLTAPEAWDMFGVGTITGAGSVPVVEDWTDYAATDRGRRSDGTGRGESVRLDSRT